MTIKYTKKINTINSLPIIIIGPNAHYLFYNVVYVYRYGNDTTSLILARKYLDIINDSIITTISLNIIDYEFPKYQPITKNQNVPVFK